MSDSAILFLAVLLVGVIVYSSLKRWFNSPIRDIEHWLKQVERGQSPDMPATCDFDVELALTCSGFEIMPLKSKNGEIVQVDWQRVIEVHGYKRDLITTDLICISITLHDLLVVEIHEEMKGFADICEKMTIALPGSLSFGSWSLAIASVPFESSLTRLFVRTPRLSPA